MGLSELKAGSKAQRSVLFRQSYWSRAEEMAPLLRSADRKRVSQSAKDTNLSRKARKAFSTAEVYPVPGMMSLEQVDKVCKRFGLWQVRRKYDIAGYPAELDEVTVLVDKQLWSGMFVLDIGLRRKIEACLLRGSTPDRRLREEVESQAGALAASIDAASTLRVENPLWESVTSKFDEVCGELYALCNAEPLR